MPTSDQLKRIEKEKLGLRYGTNTNGAAYALSDLGETFEGLELEVMLKRMKFILAPNDDEWQFGWMKSLSNTIVMITSLAKSGRLLLVTKAAPTGETYGLGKDKTFRKCNRLPNDSQIVAQLDYDENDDVKSIMNWVLSEVDKRPDPKNDFL